jgi:hypothetical protein
LRGGLHDKPFQLAGCSWLDLSPLISSRTCDANIYLSYSIYLAIHTIMSATSAPNTSSAEAASTATAAPSTATSSAELKSGSETNDMSKYGTHRITCDGCEANPVVGFRYHCTKCPDHDLCENCYTIFQNSKTLPHTNKLNPITKDPTAHAFTTYMEGKSFTAMTGAKKAAPIVKKDKVKPNDPCSCNSGKKYKKCCGKP